MKIFWLRRWRGSVVVRFGAGLGVVISRVSRVKSRRRVMRRGLGRHKVRRKERGRRGRMVMARCKYSGEARPCHVRMRLS
jgi:hypothetical protein